jgi:hypothetical protein
LTRYPVPSAERNSAKKFWDWFRTLAAPEDPQCHRKAGSSNLGRHQNQKKHRIPGKITAAISKPVPKLPPKCQLDAGGARRTTLRGLENLNKRFKVSAAIYNLSQLMRKLFGVGTPKQLAAMGKALFLVWRTILVVECELLGMGRTNPPVGNISLYGGIGSRLQRWVAIGATAAFGWNWRFFRKRLSSTGC